MKKFLNSVDPFNLTREQKETLRKNNWVIVYGASDDLIEFEGAVEDEIDAWDGASISIDKNGIVEDSKFKITAEYIDRWEIKASFKHEKSAELTSDVIIFSLDDIE